MKRTSIPTAASAASSAFTLLEMMVTMAIVACLGGFATAGYRVVREKADQVTCLTRVGHLAQGILLYAQDHQGTLPKSSHSGHSWPRLIAPYLNEPDFTASNSYRQREAFCCPKQVRSPEKADEGGSGSGSDSSNHWSYAMNVFFELSSAQRYTPAGMPIMSRDRYEGSPQTWHRLVNVERPARTILLAENRTGADHIMAHQWQTCVAPQQTLPGNRHNHGCHVAFVDGHVERLKAEETFDPNRSVNLWNPILAR